MNRPSVSVVIPTIGRDYVSRAVLSVLAQTEPVLEILVVADTEDVFPLPDDPRIRLLRVGPKAGGNTARQAGINAARGDVIGLLDDDDEWLPDKIETQLDAVGAVSDAPWIATSRVLMRRSETETLTQPDRPIEAGEDLLGYMFRKSSPRAGHGFIQASTLLFPRSLATEVEFDRSLRFHQDISWLVDVVRVHPGIRIVQVWEPLVVYYSTVGSVSKKIDPKGSIAWAKQRLVHDPRTLGDFILTQSLGFARRSGSIRAMLSTIVSGVSAGRPGLSAIVYSLGATVKAALKDVRKPRHSERVVVLMSPAASLPNDNPFVGLLVDHLPDGVVVNAFTWKRAYFSRYDVLHIHWPEHLLRAGSPLKTAIKSLLLMGLVVRNRFLAKNVRTVHNIRPHEAAGGMRERALTLWERSCTMNVYLSESGRAAATLDRRSQPSVTIPHGDYAPFVQSLGVGPVDQVSGQLLSFGYLRPYKGLEQLIEAFKAVDDAEDLSLKIVGAAVPRSYGEELLQACRDDTRIEVAIGRQRDADLVVQILASTAVVLPYKQIYNSGAALLALTLGRPILVTDSASMRELAAEVGDEWVRCISRWDADSLVTAARDLRSSKGLPVMEGRAWSDLSRRYAEVYRAVRR